MDSQGFTPRRPVPVSPPEPLESRLLPCGMEALPPAADLGYAFPPATVDANVSVAGDDPGPGPGLPARPAPQWTTGLKRILYVRVTFSDKPTHRPQTFANARSSMAFADAFFRANSFGRTSLRTTITDVIVLPRPESFYATGQWDRLRTDALAAAKAIRPAWDAKNYDHDVMRYDGGPAPLGGAAAGFAITNGRGTWLRTDEPAAAVHELGHNFGLNHANFWEGTDGDAPAGPGKHFEYGNSFSTMGSGGAAGLDGHFNAYEKHFLHWLPDDAVQTADESGRYTLRAVDSGRLPAPGEFAALKIRKDLLRTYWLSSRNAPYWANNGSLSGLEVDWGAWSRDGLANSALGSHLLDMTPGPWLDRFDYGLPLGRTFTDESIGLHFTPLSRDAAGTVEVAVEYDWDQEEPNASTPDAPKIQVGGASSGGHADDAAFPMPVFTVAPGWPISLTATSRDADGDALAYAWDFGAAAAGGAIGPGGVATRSGDSADEHVTPPATARYDAPGVYRVRVTVSDLRGRTSSSSVLVRVTPDVGAGTAAPAATPGAAAAQNVITGRVLDALGAPLPDARVGDRSVWTYTDADGSYALAGLGPAPRTLAASRPAGWSVAPAGFDNPVQPGPATRGVDFRATPVGYHITGTVLTNGGYSVKGVLVSDGTHSTLTDGLGRYSLPADNGVYDLTFFKPGYPINDARGVVVDNGDAVVRSIAQVTGVGGRVRGIPAGVTVTVSWGGGQASEEVIGGSYWFNEVPRGARIFTATGRGRDGRLYNFSPTGWANPVTVDGNEGFIDFIATPADMYTVSGRVTRGTEGVAGASVTVVDKRNGDVVVASTVTDDSGRYFVDALLAGAYSVSARKSGVELSPLGRRFVLSSNRPAVDFRAPDPPPDLPPTFLSPPAAEPADVAGVSTWLSADAEDDLDTDRLIYSWSVLSAPTGAAVTFLRNAANDARRTLATFNRPGVYQIESVVEDTRGGRATGVATVTFVSVLSTVRVNAPYAVVAPGTARRFQEVALDQFGLPIDTAGEVSWKAAGSIGAVASDGTFTASGGAAGARGTLVARVRTPFGVEVVGSATIDVAPYPAAVSVAKRIRPQRPRQALEVLGG